MTRQKSRVNDNSSIRTLIFSGFKRNLEAPKQPGKTGAIFIISKEMSLKLFQRKCQLFKSRYIHSTYLLWFFQYAYSFGEIFPNFIPRFWPRFYIVVLGTIFFLLPIWTFIFPFLFGILFSFSIWTFFLFFSIFSFCLISVTFWISSKFFSYKNEKDVPVSRLFGPSCLLGVKVGLFTHSMHFCMC